METWLAAVILIEVLMTLFVVWGILHEDKLVKFEHRTWRKLKKITRKVIRIIKAAFIALFVSEEEINRRYDERKLNF